MNDRKAELGEKIDIQTLDARAPGSAEELEAAAFTAGHGIVAKDATGKVILVDGHSYGKEKVDEVIAALLKDE